jgi:hypothetical protein
LLFREGIALLPGIPFSGTCLIFIVNAVRAAFRKLNVASVEFRTFATSDILLGREKTTIFYLHPKRRFLMLCSTELTQNVQNMIQKNTEVTFF